jgi:hypothetical protein
MDVWLMALRWIVCFDTLGEFIVICDNLDVETKRGCDIARMKVVAMKGETIMGGRRLHMTRRERNLTIFWGWQHFGGRALLIFLSSVEAVGR